MTATPNDFFVYEHWRPDLGVCFYVGKGRGDRAFRLRKNRNRYHQRIVNKLAAMELRVEVRIVSADLPESQALALEIKRIAYWRSIGTDLANATSGGEGVSGLKHSPETKRRLQETSKRIAKTIMSDPAVRAKISLSMTERMADPANRRIKSEEMTRVMADPDIRRRIGEAMTAIMSDPAVRENRSRSMVAFFSDPVNLAAHKLRNVEISNRPEIRAARSIATAESWRDPEVAADRIVKIKEALKKPEEVARRSETMRQRMADPVYREKMAAINKARHQAAREQKLQAGHVSPAGA